MGAGKSSIGRRLAKALSIPFYDSDAEIEAAAGRSVNEVFQDFGETYFREGERRVISRLIARKPLVLATGGGAFMDKQTRALIKSSALSLWLKADLETLVRRTARRDTRPLLRNGDARATLARLVRERHPIYGEADLTVKSVDGPHEVTVAAVLAALGRRLSASEPRDDADDGAPVREDPQ